MQVNRIAMHKSTRLLSALPLLLGMSAAFAQCPPGWQDTVLLDNFEAGSTVTAVLENGLDQATVTVVHGVAFDATLGGRYCNGQTITLTGPSASDPSVNWEQLHQLSDVVPPARPVTPLGDGFVFTIRGADLVDAMGELDMGNIQSYSISDDAGNALLDSNGWFQPATNITDSQPGVLNDASFTIDPALQAQFQPGHTYQLVLFDSAGNSNAPTSFIIPVALGSAQINATGTQVTGTASAGATVTLTNAAGDPVGSATAAADGSYAITISPTQPAGAVLRIVATVGAVESAAQSVTVPATTPVDPVDPIDPVDPVNPIDPIDPKPPVTPTAATPVPTLGHTGLALLTGLVLGLGALRRRTQAKGGHNQP